MKTALAVILGFSILAVFAGGCVVLAHGTHWAFRRWKPDTFEAREPVGVMHFVIGTFALILVTALTVVAYAIGSWGLS